MKNNQEVALIVYIKMTMSLANCKKSPCRVMVQITLIMVYKPNEPQ